MPEDGSLYEFLGKIDAFNGQYIGGNKGMKKLINKLDIQKNLVYKVLEVGAATGYTSCYVAKEYGCSVTSTDISEILVEKGRRRAKKLGLGNIEFQVADAMNLNFPDNTFDAVYGLAITGLLPNRLRALREYVRVVKPGGMVGGLELYPREDASPDVLAALNVALGKIMGTGNMVFKLGDWKGLLSESDLVDVEVDASCEDVFENPRVSFGTVLTYFKLVYYLLSNSWFRSMFFEVMELRKSVSKTSDDIFNNVGYLIYTGRKLI